MGEYQVGGLKMEFYVMPVPKPSLGTNEFSADTVVAAFWWVSQTHDKSLANVVMENAMSNGVGVPVLKNSIDIPPYSKLVMFVPSKAKAEPTQGKVKGSGDPSTDKHAKKQRKA